MEFFVRSATLEDAHSIATVIACSRSLYLPFLPLIYTQTEMGSWVEEVLIPTEKVSVAEHERQIIGVISTSYESGVTWVSQLYVRPPSVSKGVGATLLASALSGVQTVVKLYTFQENFRARRFYQYHGFVEAACSDGSSNEEKCPDVLLVRDCSLTHGSSGHPIVGGTSLRRYFTLRAANYRMPLNLNVRRHSNRILRWQAENRSARGLGNSWNKGLV